MSLTAERAAGAGGVDEGEDETSRGGWVWNGWMSVDHQEFIDVKVKSVEMPGKRPRKNGHFTRLHMWVINGKGLGKGIRTRLLHAGLENVPNHDGGAHLCEFQRHLAADTWSGQDGA